MSDSKGLAEGHVIGGEYRIEHLAAETEFATTYFGTRIASKTPVLLRTFDLSRFLPPASLPMIRRRFVNEARQIAEVAHANLEAVHGAGEEQSLLYLATEHMGSDTSLARLLGSARPTAEGATHFMLQILAGLSEAHRHGHPHRDLTPARVHVRSDGSLKIADFALVKLFHTLRGTREGFSIVHAYSAPEVVRGDELLASSDLYAAGAIAYELYVGAAPFTGGDTELRKAIVEQPLQIPPDIGQRLPERLRRFLETALAKDVSARFPDADEMALELSYVRAALRLADATPTIIMKFPKEKLVPSMTPSTAHPEPNVGAVPTVAAAASPPEPSIAPVAKMPTPAAPVETPKAPPPEQAKREVHWPTPTLPRPSLPVVRESIAPPKIEILALPPLESHPPPKQEKAPAPPPWARAPAAKPSLPEAPATPAATPAVTPPPRRRTSEQARPVAAKGRGPSPPVVVTIAAVLALVVGYFILGFFDRSKGNGPAIPSATPAPSARPTAPATEAPTLATPSTEETPPATVEAPPTPLPTSSLTGIDVTKLTKEEKDKLLDLLVDQVKMQVAKKNADTARRAMEDLDKVAPNDARFYELETQVLSLAISLPPTPLENQEVSLVTVDQAPVLDRHKAPPFPKKKPEDFREVLIKALIDAEGNVVDTQVQRDDEFGSGAIAATAVKQWTFEPATYQGVKVKVWIAIPIRTGGAWVKPRIEVVGATPTPAATPTKSGSKNP